MRTLLLGLMFFLWRETPSPSDALHEIEQSGRCAVVGESADSRVETPKLIAPGSPPLLSFRYFEDQKHHRFDNSDLMLDDAGH